jgi:hypothetical protein
MKVRNSDIHTDKNKGGEIRGQVMKKNRTIDTTPRAYFCRL